MKYGLAFNVAVYYQAQLKFLANLLFLVCEFYPISLNAKCILVLKNLLGTAYGDNDNIF